MSTTKKFILIIDDSQTNNLLLQAVLEEEGYTVQTTLTALEALNILYKEKPALVLLDLFMPKSSGFQLLEKIKQNEEFVNVPVIIISSLNDRDATKRLFEIGANEFLPKPVDINMLKNIVSRYLSK